jgi:predicted membrane metal-binding protein
MAFAIGICIGRYAWRPPTWWLVAACSFLFAAAYFRHRKSAFSWALALGAFVLCGALAIQISGTRSGEIWLGDNQAVEVSGHVISDGSVRNAATGLHQQVDLETETIESANRTQSVRTGIRLSVYAKYAPEQKELDFSHDAGPGTIKPLAYGQRLRFSAVLNVPRNFRNPGAFDYAGYLHDQGIAATASVKYSEIEFLPGFSGSRVTYNLARIRRSILDRIHLLWPEQDAALLDAMLLGEVIRRAA